MRKCPVAVFLLIAYCAVLVKVMVFKDVPLIRVGALMINFGGSQTGPANLVPFKTILVYLLGDKGLLIAGINLIGNIVLLMPVGFVVPFFSRKIRWRNMLAIAALAGFAIEGMQVLLRLGIFDIDDVILNGLGVMVGYWAFTILTRNLRSMGSRDIRILVVTIFVVAVAAGSYGIVAYQKGKMPLRLERNPKIRYSPGSDHREAGIDQRKDPCGGTGGTGKIIGMRSHFITIQARNGAKEVIKVTDQTMIRNSAQAISESDLSIGNSVTIVTLESDQEGNKIAKAILVCNVSSSGTKSLR
jgi:glycopeptide antibiotics resistance protein